MEEKTMGGFISALRKANGMTQQTLADHLNVSNKAVSRWERDECAPDIMLLPAIAELFGVTCDELLKGERIAAAPVGEAPKPQPKSEKRLRAILSGAVSRFKIAQLIALSLSFVGIVMLFSISYGFYKPVVASGVLGLFVIASAVVNFASVMNLNTLFSEDSELFDASESLTGKARGTMLRLCRVNVFVGLFAVCAMLPMLLMLAGAHDMPIDSVITINSYIEMFPSVFFLGVNLCFGANMLLKRLLGFEKRDDIQPKELKFPKIAQSVIFAVSLFTSLVVILFIGIALLNISAMLLMCAIALSLAALVAAFRACSKCEYGAKKEYMICRIRSFLLTLMLVFLMPPVRGETFMEDGTTEKWFEYPNPLFALAGFALTLIISEIALRLVRSRSLKSRPAGE